MDEFGVLVESIGFKAHGKSAPMAKSKPKPRSHFAANSSVTNTAAFNDSSSLPVDELDGIFRSNLNIDKTRQSQSFEGDDDIFGAGVASSNQFGGIDLESVLNSSSNKTDDSNLNLRNSGGVNGYDDLLGDFGVKSGGNQESKASGFDDLIPGFRGANPTNKGVHSNDRSSNSSTTHGDDPFLVFESSVSQSDGSRSFAGPSEQDTRKDPTQSSLDELDDFAMGRTQNDSKYDGKKTTSSKSEQDARKDPIQSSLDELDDFAMGRTQNDSKYDGEKTTSSKSEQDARKDPIQSSLDELDDFAMGRTQNDSKSDGKKTTSSKPSPDTASNEFANVDDLDAIFGGGAQQKRAAPASTAQNSQFDILFGKEKQPQAKQTSSATNFGDNFTALFGDITTSSEEFQEIEGEPEERRRARLNRHMRTNARVAEALAEKNQRDLQSQHEQDEKHRLGETLDNDIRCWAAGKEGNLRALLSSLQQVLWPECGWRPVSLTDMITSDSVKKVYKKATLYVHPDKVQQKGATLQQKYIAEKVFDLLKEAWNKFSAEELR